MAKKKVKLMDDRLEICQLNQQAFNVNEVYTVAIKGEMVPIDSIQRISQ